MTKLSEAKTLEEFFMADCEILGGVPAYWSDLYSHGAITLALLYRWAGARGRGTKTVEEWLTGWATSEHVIKQVNWFLAQLPPTERELYKYGSDVLPESLARDGGT